MIGRMTAIIINLFIMTILIFLSVSYFLQQTIQENINNLNYNVIEVVSTTGVLSEELYQYIEDNINKYGDYIIKLKLEKQIKAGIYDTFYDPSVIIDQKLQIGDRLTIYLEDMKLTLFGRLINASFLGFTPEKYIDIRIKSIKTAVISKTAKDLVKGYDVITDIDERQDDNNISIFVATKRNVIGIYYGVSSHDNVESTNLYYGDSSNESEDTGVDYIFPNGEFIKQLEYYPAGHVLHGQIKLIKYFQQ